MDTSTCSAFVSPSGRYTWTESGIHKDTIFGTGDCFMEITVNLSLFSPTSSSIDTVVCLNFVPDSQASYAVEVILTGCRDTSACYAFDNTGIAAILGDESFVLYPNPTDGDITISFNEKQQDITIQAVNMMGELISEKNYKNVDVIHYQINGENGIYILKLMNANEMKATIKVIKN